jgi:uroporphyrinogen decarboxylase
MLPRERVINVIRHGRPDRIPIYGWLRENLREPITEAFGSVEAFEDRYEFDLAHILDCPPSYPPPVLDERQHSGRATIEPEALLDVELLDPNAESFYEPIIRQIRHHKEERGRFVYVQTPGIFECLNEVFGIENHLCYLIQHEAALHRVYLRQAEWNRTFAHNCLDLGVDMIHVSDDWGAQRGPLFSPQMWRNLIFPYHKITCDAVKQRGAFLSLHSDGDISLLLEGVAELGYDVVHPYQESAGMDYALFRQRYMDRMTIMGGLDVQTTIGFGDLGRLRAEIERVMSLFADGGLLYCTTHFVQNHCTMEELTFAFDTIYEVSRRVCRR